MDMLRCVIPFEGNGNVYVYNVKMDMKLAELPEETQRQVIDLLDVFTAFN